jgi:hypothetical protein
MGSFDRSMEDDRGTPVLAEGALDDTPAGLLALENMIRWMRFALWK